MQDKFSEEFEYSKKRENHQIELRKRARDEVINKIRHTEPEIPTSAYLIDKYAELKDLPYKS